MLLKTNSNNTLSYIDYPREFAISSITSNINYTKEKVILKTLQNNSFLKMIVFLKNMYDLEIGKVISEIKKQNAKTVCLHLPDGLKQKAEELQKEIEKHTNAQVIIWGGSCYGSCDLPLEVKHLGVDLLIHFGHSPWQDIGLR